MATKKIKRIIIAGAGFSAPAKLPIQSKIIQKMIENPAEDDRINFMSQNVPVESIKFLNAFIVVGLYLLDVYGKGMYSNLSYQYSELRRQKLLESRNLGNKPESLNDSPSIGDCLHTGVISSIATQQREHLKTSDFEEDYYAALCKIRGDVRDAIKKEQISVSLEDVFTSFDKSTNTREHLYNYSYSDIDEIRFSITSLFIYYFSKCVQEHDYTSADYTSFINFIQKTRTKEPTTIITTNWDTLIEEYCTRRNISYDYCFYNSYTSSFNLHPAPARVNLIKIHGSVNWLKCLRCGGISIYSAADAARSLFEDDVVEECKICCQQDNLSAPTLHPVIITPTMLKSFSDHIYTSLWWAASRELSSATHITFVGYSFPVADFEFRYMLQKNIPADAVIDVVLTANSNPAKAKNRNSSDMLPEKRYREAFPKNEIHFFYDGFSNYFSNI